MTMLAVFRSRTQALDAVSRLRAAGIPAQAVATPKEAGCGCGLSARFDARFYARVRLQFASHGWSTFAGLYRENACGGYVRVFGP